MEALAVDVEPEARLPSNSNETLTHLEHLESNWSRLPVNLFELEDPSEKPSEDIFEPSPIWEQPPGCAIQGIDAFKVYCHINRLKELAVLAVGDLGAAPT
jgi:hypothetical protein